MVQDRIMNYCPLCRKIVPLAISNTTFICQGCHAAMVKTTVTETTWYQLTDSERQGVVDSISQTAIQESQLATLAKIYKSMDTVKSIIVFFTVLIIIHTILQLLMLLF